MQDGGPIAFYEIAATLIPLLLLGGVVLDGLLYPPGDNDKQGPFDVARALLERCFGIDEPASRFQRWMQSIWRLPRKLAHRLYRIRRPVGPWIENVLHDPTVFGFGVVLLPIVLVWMFLAEMVALDAVASGTADSTHAIIVGGTLVGAVLIVVVSWWLPWLLRYVEWLEGKRGGDGSGQGEEKKRLSPLLVAFPMAIGLALVVVLLLRSWVAPSANDLYESVKTPPIAAEQVWLNHLVATSDYRIDKLQAERETNHAADDRIDRHLETQEAVQAEECKALDAINRHGSSGEGTKALPATCLE